MAGLAGWMAGWMDGWMDGPMDGRDGRTACIRLCMRVWIAVDLD